MSTPRPWEETWEAETGEARGIVWRGRRGLLVLAQGAEDAAPLIAATPDMARALLAVLPHEDEAGPKPPAHIRECLEWRQRHGLITECATGCQEVMAALRKAGVIS